MTDMFLIMIGLIVGLVLGGGLVFIVMWSLGGSEAAQIMKARMMKRSRLFEITEPNGRFHFVCVKRDDEAPFYNIKKYATIVPNPTTAANIQPKRGEKGLEIWECATDTPILIDLPSKIVTVRCLEICRQEYPMLVDYADSDVLSLLTTKNSELLHDCEALCGDDAEVLYDVILDCKRKCRDVAISGADVIFTDYHSELEELRELLAASEKEDEEESGKKRLRLRKKRQPKAILVGTAKYPRSAYFIDSAAALDAMPWTNQSSVVRKGIELMETLAKVTGTKDYGWVKVMAPLLVFAAVAVCMMWIVIGNGGVGV